jgi:multicomponent Na+:H+ antiporter subunit A
VIDHQTGTRDIRQLAGLRRAMPFSAVAGALAAASMAGLPPFLGFLGKEQAYDAVLGQPLLPQVLIAALVLSSGLLGASGLLAGALPFLGKQSSPGTVHEATSGLWLVPLCLGALGLSAVVAGAFAPVLGHATSSVTGKPFAPSLALWHGWTLPLLLSVVTISLSYVVYRSRATLRRFTWPRALGTERLYTASLRWLEGMGARISPALQDGSLTSYVLTFVVATGALIGMAFLLTTGVPIPEEILPVRVHEVFLAVLVMGAALGAVRAKTTMTAVLSLGAAGYGVALTFLLYGAPDLAMTQFAVETLTAVIFVFVFWQLPRTEERTSRRIKQRDAFVSIAFGALVSVLTLAAATHPTNSRLRDFYATAAPTLAHGRNIVNVLLVDFRALDTLGEITVLVTAALGVSALLRIAAAQKQAD